MDLNLKIIFEDDFFLAIEKPAGVVVNNAVSVGDAETVEDWAREKIKNSARGGQAPSKIKNDESEYFKRAGIVHRLDKETSGILLIAKNESVFLSLQDAFKNHEIHKKYASLVHGLTEKEGLLDFNIVRHGKKGKFVVGPGGKNSLTEFKLIKNYKFNDLALNDFKRKNFERLNAKYDLENYSLVDVKIYTGRTHQIRVHFAHIKHPVVGDELYGFHKMIKFERVWCPRQFLHAKELSLIHPVTKKEICLKSGLPEDLGWIIRTYMTDKTNRS